MDIKREREKFKDHVATFTDYGNIKILDFKKPDSSYYRIRFLFEEDFYRLHISGDLGELTAINCSNMVYDKFSDFVESPDYFEEKVICHNRPVYVYDYNKAKMDIIEYLKENGYLEIILNRGYEWQSEKDILEEFFNEALGDFSENAGIGARGSDFLFDNDFQDIFDDISDFGKKNTGILDLYLLAFKLAKKQVECRKH